MGFFGSKSEENVEPSKIEEKVNTQQEVLRDNISIPTKDVSNLINGIKTKADIEGKGSLIIGGEFDGNVKIEETLFIEKGAKFSGIAHAKNVKIAGDFTGTIYATATEITKAGSFNGNINSIKTFLGGVVNGVIVSNDSIEITKDGVVDAKECKSKQIKVEGSVKGRVIASELLEVTRAGSIEGDIITKGIRTEQGGTIIGNIQTYDESIHSHTLDENSASGIDDEVAKLINIKPEEISKYAKKDNNTKSVN